MVRIILRMMRDEPRDEEDMKMTVVVTAESDTARWISVALERLLTFSQVFALLWRTTRCSLEHRVSPICP